MAEGRITLCLAFPGDCMIGRRSINMNLDKTTAENDKVSISQTIRKRSDRNKEQRPTWLTVERKERHTNTIKYRETARRSLRKNTIRQLDRDSLICLQWSSPRTTTTLAYCCEEKIWNRVVTIKSNKGNVEDPSGQAQYNRMKSNRRFHRPPLLLLSALRRQTQLGLSYMYCYIWLRRHSIPTSKWSKDQFSSRQHNHRVNSNNTEPLPHLPLSHPRQASYSITFVPRRPMVADKLDLTLTRLQL